MTLGSNKNSSSLKLHSPAKVNLFLAVHGKRADERHELTSLMAALDFGDCLTVRRREGEDRLYCDNGMAPKGLDNLVLLASRAFREKTGTDTSFSFELKKRIPVGAGLGGGSGNAATALCGMNALLDNPLDHEELAALAAGIGSDCPFFLDARPSVVRGRGEVLEPLHADAANRLRGMRLALFQPPFSIDTGRAYRRLAAEAPETYQDSDWAEERLRWFTTGGSIEELLFNAFERPIGWKYLALPALLGNLRTKGQRCLMSGSGSCCFALLNDGGASSEELRKIVKEAWGDAAFFVESLIL
ncbi:MAG: 4-(cytidine 5'-diphospho)-2-C-methyl-D-erythritol kinase [Opitutales bacterium]